MKKTANQMIDKINTILSNHQQKTRIVAWTGSAIILSGGQTLSRSDRLRFIRRITNNKTDLWVNNIDNLLSGQITEKEIKSALSRIGGLSCQQKYGDKIKLNLNTGVPWSKGLKGNYPYKFGPQSQEVKEKISAKNSGAGNGMYGVRMSDAERQKKSLIMKKKILSGEFTPNSNNRNTHWDSELDGICYRSSWEALYKYINPAAEYEVLRLEYQFETVTRIYIVDFVDHINKIVVEIKPKELCVGPKFDTKIKALHTWAKDNSYKVLLVDKEWLLKNKIEIDYSRFNSIAAIKIKKLYETNKTN